MKPDEIYIEKNEDGTIIDKDTGEEIYNPNENYGEKVENSLPEIENINGDYIIEYLKWFFLFYPERSFKSFTKDEMDSIISMSVLMYQPSSEQEITKEAKKYFNIDNYILPTGTYIIKNYGKYTITKSDGLYHRSETKEKVEEKPFSLITTDLTINENHITVSYDYMYGSVFNGGCYSPLKTEEENKECILGKYKINLTYNQEQLIVDEIEYIKNEQRN